MVLLTLDPTRTRLAIHFEYRQDLVDRVKLFPGRVWKKPFWTLPLTPEGVEQVVQAFKPLDNVAKAQDLLDLLAGKEKEQAEVLSWKTTGLELKLPEGFTFVTTPYAHQKTATSYCVHRKSFGLFMEMGTGKTKVILDLLGNYYKDDLAEVARVGSSLGKQGNLAMLMKHPSLIVCPVSVLRNWQREAAIHQPHLRVVVARGSRGDKLLALEKVKQGQADILVINYESLWRHAKEFSSLNWWAMVLDESTKIKHRGSQMAKGVMKVGEKAFRRYIMTGTPAPNSPLELFNQVRFLDPTVFGHSWYAFRDRYAMMGGYGGYQVLGWKNLPELSKKLAGISYRVLKKDCLDLPEKVYKEYRLPMGAGQKKTYDELCDDLVTTIKGVDIMAPVVLAKLTKLRQLASGFVYGPDGRVIRLAENPKLDQLREILQTICNDHKVVVWTVFKEEVEAICHLCQDLGIKFITLDGSNSGQNQDQIFQTTEDIRVFIANQQSGGMGITLTKADYSIFYSNDYSYGVREQAEDRLHRIGQKNAVTYIDLIMKGTLETTIKRMLKTKQNLAAMLVPSNIQDVLYDKEDL